LASCPSPPSRPALDRPYNIAVGGRSAAPACWTIGALLGMAAHIEGKASMILDMSGLAQKRWRGAQSRAGCPNIPPTVTCSRIVTGTADLVPRGRRSRPRRPRTPSRSASRAAPSASSTTM